MIRQPIVSVVGHIDHGKTSLLDRLRGTCLIDKEAGKITQHVSSTAVPIDTIRFYCGDLLDKLGLDITIPGLLFIDTPGHAAFNTLRKRGGALADIAILVINVMEGVMPQTLECISILKHNKTPFVVALTHIDLIPGWQTNANEQFLVSLNKQKPEVQEEIEKRLYGVVGKLSEEGINSERYDRIKDFTQAVAIVPVSPPNCEGIQDLMMVITGLSQKYLEEKLDIEVSGPGKGTILEVKEEQGVGTVLEVILYDGVIKKDDKIAVMGKDGPIVTKVKSLMRPFPLTESRLGKNFDTVGEAHAAAGVKVVGQNVEGVLSGSPLRVVATGNEAEEVEAEFTSVKIETDKIGIVLKADTFGSLEALIAYFGEHDIPIRSGDVGPVSNRDISAAEAVRKNDPLLGVVFAFHTNILPEAEEKADGLGIKLFKSNIIYRLEEEYSEWKSLETERQKLEKLGDLPKPAVVRFLPGYMFRQSNPAVFGVEVECGELTQKVGLMKEDGVRIGTVSEIQNEGKTISKAKKGQQVAVSVLGPTIGRQINEGDILVTDLTEEQIERLKNLKNLLSESEIEALKRVILVKNG